MVSVCIHSNLLKYLCYVVCYIHLLNLILYTYFSIAIVMSLLYSHTVSFLRLVMALLHFYLARDVRDLVVK